MPPTPITALAGCTANPHQIVMTMTAVRKCKCMTSLARDFSLPPLLQKKTGEVT
jgi:hypothetical protein